MSREIPAPSERNRFNPVQKLCKSTPEYYCHPWQYYTDFVELLRARGARFITMSEAINGEYEADDLCVLLDHHIDHYPVETEVIARWELEQGLRSNIYLFNRFIERKSAQRKLWQVEDLDIAFYQQLEAEGFEIGYHQNAVGQVRGDKVSRTYLNHRLSPDEISRAKQVFAEDVDNLSRYFRIRTFIPHGGGENNAYLTDIPEQWAHLHWVYNNAADRRSVNWSNFSDASGGGTQFIGALRAVYIVNVDNLHVQARMSCLGLHHFVLHAGRYGLEMPYELYGRPGELADYSVLHIERHIVPGNDEVQLDRLPVRQTEIVAEWTKTRSQSSRLSARCDFFDEPFGHRQGKYYLLTDHISPMFQHMSQSDLCIAFLCLHSPADTTTRRQLRQFVRHRRAGGQGSAIQEVEMPAPVIERIDDDFWKSIAPVEKDFLTSTYKHYNLVASEVILKHILQVDPGYDVVDLHRLPLTKPQHLSQLHSFLVRFAGTSHIRIRLTGPLAGTAREMIEELRPLAESKGAAFEIRLLAVQSEQPGWVVQSVPPIRAASLPGAFRAADTGWWSDFSGHIQVKNQIRWYDSAGGRTASAGSPSRSNMVGAGK